MAINLNDISTKVMKLMQGSGHAMKMFDATSGKSVATPDEARFFYVKEPNMMVHIDGNTKELKFHIGEDIDIDNEQIHNMMNQLKSLARTNMLDFDIRSFGKHIEPKNYAYKVKQNKENTMNDQVNEGMGPLSGSSRTSRQTLENVKLILKHRAPVNEESRGSRSRNISAIFVETGEGERFKYPFIHLNGARAMARHVASGGETHDMVGEAIIEMSDNLSRLKEFMNVVNKQQLVNETNRADVWNVKRSVMSIKEKIQRIQGAKGYASFVEDMALNDRTPQQEISEEMVDAYVKKFTKSTFEENLKDIFPLLHRVNEEEMENRRDNQTARVKEIMTAVVKKTGERMNKITFGAPSSSSYDYAQIKKQFAEPRTPEEAAQLKINKIAMTFDDLADRVQVDTLLDKKSKKKGHDLAAEVSFFLTDIANEIRSNPRGMDKEDMQVAGTLLKMSKASVETVEPKSADTRISEMLEEAFSKFDSDKILEKNKINEDESLYDAWDDMCLNVDADKGISVVFDMKNMPEKRFHVTTSDSGEAGNPGHDHVFVSIDSGMSDHDGDDHLELEDVKNNMTGAALTAQVDGKVKILKTIGSFKNWDDVLPPEPRDPDLWKYPDENLVDSVSIDEDNSELEIAKKKPTLDDLIQMSNEADYEMGDIVVFGMKNHPAYRFDLQGDLKDYMERVRVASTHGGTDHSGFLNMKVSEIADNIDGAAIIAIEDDNKSPFQDGNNIKSMVGWSSADEVYPPNTDDEQSGEDEDGAFASGPDNDQVRMRHLAGLDDF